MEIKTQEELTAMTVVQLSAYAEEQQVPLVGREKKAELIAAILTHQQPDGVEGAEAEDEVAPDPAAPPVMVTYEFNMKDFGDRLGEVPNAVRTKGGSYTDNMATKQALVKMPLGVDLPEWVAEFEHKVLDC